MNIKQIDSKVIAILSKLSPITLPIKIEDIAKQLGLRVTPYPLGDDISGVLVIENSQSVIGYNQNESRVRRRFTIAHEIGHYELHKDKSNLFLDKQFKIYRRQNSSITSDNQKMEQEANTFAAGILMPEEKVREEVEKIEIDLGGEEAIKKMAKIFDVSTTSMYFRISNLRLI